MKTDRGIEELNGDTSRLSCTCTSFQASLPPLPQLSVPSASHFPRFLFHAHEDKHNPAPCSDSFEFPNVGGGWAARGGGGGQDGVPVMLLLCLAELPVTLHGIYSSCVARCILGSGEQQETCPAACTSSGQGAGQDVLIKRSSLVMSWAGGGRMCRRRLMVTKLKWVAQVAFKDWVLLCIISLWGLLWSWDVIGKLPSSGPWQRKPPEVLLHVQQQMTNMLTTGLDITSDCTFLRDERTRRIFFFLVEGSHELAQWPGASQDQQSQQTTLVNYLLERQRSTDRTEFSEINVLEPNKSNSKPPRKNSQY